MARKRNPKPRIGRQDKTFIPSKKLQRQYKTVQRKYEKRQLEPEQSEQPQPFKRQTAEEFFGYEKGVIGSAVPKRPVYTSIVDKLTILSNELGMGETADLIGITDEQLDHVLQGNHITPRQEAMLEHSYTGLQLDDETDIDFEQVGQLAKELQQAVVFVNEERYLGEKLKKSFRYSVALGKVDIENENDLKELGHFFIAGFQSTRIKNLLVDWLAENDHHANEFFDLYKDDLANGIVLEKDAYIDGEGSSEFWAWFRETFYS